MKTVKGYKGFNPDLTCLGYQYVVGKKFKETASVGMYQKGFHFCEKPLHVLVHYVPYEYGVKLSRYCEVTGSGNVQSRHDVSVSDNIAINEDIGVMGLINAAISKSTYVNKNEQNSSHSSKEYEDIIGTTGTCTVTSVTGEYSIAINSDNYGVAASTAGQSAAVSRGYYSVASSIGRNSVSLCEHVNSVSAVTQTGSRAMTNNDYSISAASGWCSAATTGGKESIAASTAPKSLSQTSGETSIAASVNGYSSADGKDSIAIAINGAAKASVGNWLVLSDVKAGKVACVKAFYVDGEAVKADTYYRLRNGRLTPVL